MTTAIQTRALSKPQAERLRDEINEDAVNVREKVQRFHDGKGWEALGYKSFKECADAEFSFGRSYAYRLLEAAEVASRVSPNGDMRESHVRELKVVAPDKQKEVYEQAKKTAPNGKLTAEHIKQTVDNMKLGPNRWGKRATESNWDDYLEALDRLTAPQLEVILRKCLPSIPSRVLFKAVDEARHMMPSEMSTFNSAPWSHEAV